MMPLIMSDVFAREKRSEIMGRIRSKNTKPEMAVRKALTKMGLRYRLHSRILPGKPDIMIPSMKTIIFVNGCFWHQHSGCKRKAVPKSNCDYWENKLQNNIIRQRRDVRELRKLGWTVLKIWECQTAGETRLAAKLSRML
jgi:DNA mismatch endonuclease (patch repair protein)